MPINYTQLPRIKQHGLQQGGVKGYNYLFKNSRVKSTLQKDITHGYSKLINP